MREALLKCLETERGPLTPLMCSERNAVYSLKNGDILKIYAKKIRWEQELLALGNVVRSSIFIPEILEAGAEEDLYWAVMTRGEGLALSDYGECYLSHLPSLGKLLGEYHSSNPVKDLSGWTNREGFFGALPHSLKDSNETSLALLRESDFFDKDLLPLLTARLGEYGLGSIGELVLCHNDFSERNLLVEKDSEVSFLFKSFIDFELCFPGEPCSDMSRLFIEFLSREKRVIYIQEFLKGYFSSREPEENFSQKCYYYSLSLCLDVCTWARNRAPDYYFKVYGVLKDLVKNPVKFLSYLERAVETPLVSR